MEPQPYYWMRPLLMGVGIVVAIQFGPAIEREVLGFSATGALVVGLRAGIGAAIGIGIASLFVRNNSN